MHVYVQAIIDAFGAAVLWSQGEVWPVIGLSLAVSGTATLIATAIGLPIGYFLGMSRFAGRGSLILLVNTAMGWPPVVVGLFVYMALSRTGPLGGLALLFTPQAMVIAQVILAAPLIAGVTHRGHRQRPARPPVCSCARSARRASRRPSRCSRSRAAVSWPR